MAIMIHFWYLTIVGKQNQIGVRMPKTISARGKMICKTHQFLQRENGNENSSYQS
jgi:hypothetical protein